MSVSLSFCSFSLCWWIVRDVFELSRGVYVMANIYPRIIAVRSGGDSYLVETSEGRGVVYVLRSRIVSEEMQLDAFLKFGYWEELQESMMIDELE